MDRLPKPVPGLVVRYGYLWSNEHEAGRSEAAKDRPCAIILAVEGGGSEASVVVLPITRSQPHGSTPSVEIPSGIKRRLGLDGERSWILLSEGNHFSWPGFDLRWVNHADGPSVAYGLLPANFFRVVRDSFVAAFKRQRPRMIDRNDG